MTDSNITPATKYRVLAYPPGCNKADTLPLKAVVAGFDWDDAAAAGIHKLADKLSATPGTWTINTILLRANGTASEFSANGFCQVDADGIRQPPMGDWAKLGLVVE